MGTINTILLREERSLARSWIMMVSSWVSLKNYYFPSMPWHSMDLALSLLHSIEFCIMYHFCHMHLY